MGAGMSPDPVDDRYGIKGMQERAQLIQAVLEVESSPETGTRVRLVKELER